MHFENAIAQRHHVFGSDEYTVTPIACQHEIAPEVLLYEAVNKENGKKYLLLKSINIFDTDEAKYSFIRHSERATQLAHPVLFELSGFSDSVPDLYFDYYPGLNAPITDEQLQSLSDTSVQIIILGMISGLSYLISKGYSVPHFSLNSIFFSEDSGPKFINYSNPTLLVMDYPLDRLVEKCDKIKLVHQVGQVIRELLCRRRKKDDNEELPIPDNTNEKLVEYITNCDKEEEECPKLDDLFPLFADLFKNDKTIEKYLEKLDSADKFRYDFNMDQPDYVPFKILKDENGHYYANRFFDNRVNILHSCYIQEDVFNHKEYFPLLNRLPDADIQLLLQAQKDPPKLLYEFLCYEREYILLPEIKPLFFSSRPENNYLIYEKLMEKSKVDSNLAIFPIALKHLKMAVKRNHKEGKLKLALHYLKGDIVPPNYEKALTWLKSLAFGNQENVSRYIDPINDKVKEIEAAIKKLGPKEKEALQKAEDGNVLYLLYVAFAFYSGIDNFPISPTKAVKYYRLAAEKSPNCMCLLGGMYLRGYIFPRDLVRAQHCFEKAAVSGQIKAKILDSLMRKHVWRSYLSDVSIQTVYNTYMQTPESLSFDDTLIFPTINFLIENQQNDLLQTAPFMSSYYFYDQRNECHNLKKNETKFGINMIDYRVPTMADDDIEHGDAQIFQFFTFLHVVNNLLSANILPQQLNPVYHEIKPNFLVSRARNFLEDKFGFILNQDDDDSDITQQNMQKCEIYHDMESRLFTPIQSKFIPFDKDSECTTITYIPQISIPNADDRIKEIKQHIDDCLKKIMPHILERDKDNQFIANLDAKEEDDIKEMNRLEKLLKEAFQNETPLHQMFINEIDHFNVYHSEPIFFSEEINNVAEDDMKKQLHIADSYFNGINGFPVNYTEAAKYYKMAADRGNADAQWKYGQFKVNGLGTKQDAKDAYMYLKRSAEQANPDGMLRYGLFIRHFLINHGKKEDIKWPSFQNYIEKSAATDNLEAINQLAMILESNYSYEDGTAKAITKYEDCLHKGRIDSVFRIIPILDATTHAKRYRELVKLSVGICDHDITKRMIQICNSRKRYEQSRLIINAGLCFDKEAFLPNYAAHVALYSSKGTLQQRIEYAKSLLTPILRNPSPSIMKKGYLENYLMAMLIILSKANEYEEACKLFIEHMNCLTMNSKDEFIDFYMHINKKVAREYQLSINSYLPEYRACVEAILLIKKKGIHVRAGNEKLKKILQENSSNQFALLQRGKILLKNHLFMRRNISKALVFIEKAAQQNCPEARFEYGKQLYYGQTIPMNRWKAFKYFMKAFNESNQDPRAGYFLSKKCYIQRNLITAEEAEKSLTVAVRSGYRRALFKLGKRFVGKDKKAALGIMLIKKAREQDYYKAIDFLNHYEGGLADDEIQDNEEDAYFTFAKELYYGRIIAQDLKMSFSLFMKFFKKREPDMRAGYYLSKKKFIQMELIKPEEARRALVISAKAHYKRALYRLGKLYYVREGKKEKGILLMIKAKKLNYEKAINFLNEIKTNQLIFNSSEDELSTSIPAKKVIEQTTDESEVAEEASKKEQISENIHIHETLSAQTMDLTREESNQDVDQMRSIMKLRHSSSKLMKSKDLNEPLLNNYHGADDLKIGTAQSTNNVIESKSAHGKFNLKDDVTSDFSDEPIDMSDEQRQN